MCRMSSLVIRATESSFRTQSEPRAALAPDQLQVSHFQPPEQARQLAAAGLMIIPAATHATVRDQDLAVSGSERAVPQSAWAHPGPG
jgi:hypothetical protein